MGNRATVIFWNGETKPAKRSISPAVYLHWNGGPESIYAFLEELDRRDVRADQEYECARFTQVVSEFFTWSTERDLSDPIYSESAYGLSLGVVNGPKSDKPADLDKVMTDHGDNGVYLVNRTVPDGDPARMRRFLEYACHRDTGRRISEGSLQPAWEDMEFKFFELPADVVQAEREEALASDYIPDIREFYVKFVERAQPVSQPTEKGAVA